MHPTPDYLTHIERLVGALDAAGAAFRLLDTLVDEIGGVVSYAKDDGNLIYDVLVIPDEQDPSAGRYLFRHIDSHPLHVPCFEFRSDDPDAVINAMKDRGLLQA